jgi:hypothetical protein
MHTYDRRSSCGRNFLMGLLLLLLLFYPKADLGPKGQWASCRQRSEECVYTFNKRKDKKKVYKGPKLFTSGAKGSMPRGGESMGICVFHECQTAGELGTYEPLAETR